MARLKPAADHTCPLAITHHYGLLVGLLGKKRLRSVSMGESGFIVDTAVSGEEGPQKALQVRPDLVVLDLMLPNIDGLEVCRQLRTNPDLSEVAIVMMTAKMPSSKTCWPSPALNETPKQKRLIAHRRNCSPFLPQPFRPARPLQRRERSRSGCSVPRS